MSELTDKDVFREVVTNENNVRFSTYKFKDPIVTPSKLSGELEEVKTKKSVCFAHLLDGIKKANNMAYIVIDINECNYKLEDENVLRWLKVAKRHKLLPYYITPKCYQDKKIKTHLVLENLSPSLIYIYLSFLRYPREFPSLVETALHLYDGKGMNFWTAFGLASYAHVTSTGHHISEYIKGSIYSSYKNRPTTVTRKIDTSFMIGLQRMINAPKKYDKRVSVVRSGDGWKVKSKESFNCANTLDNIVKKNKYMVPINDLFNHRVVRMINSTYNETLEHEWELYKKEKE